MLTGFTTPLTTTGGSGLVGFPPWRCAGVMFAIEYRTGPEGPAFILPPALTPSEDTGCCVARFADWRNNEGRRLAASQTSMKPGDGAKYKL